VNPAADRPPLNLLVQEVKHPNITIMSISTTPILTMIIKEK
jgi:hypothetical protein